ncbi:MAG: PAS domain S-box protein, partial [Planctomycetes bacterium]|nr:PAS domain S-box protein [Planctomycetota bacterium]
MNSNERNPLEEFPSNSPHDRDPASDLGPCYILGSMDSGLPERKISLSNMIETMREAAMFLDMDHRIRCWNERAGELFQYSADEVLGQDVEFLLPPDLIECQELEQLRAICNQEGVLHNYVTRRRRKDGSQVWVSLTRTVVHDEQGQSVGAIAILRDVSQQKSGEVELRKSRSLAMVGELA